jgi:large subunit ribosomal protein L25
MDTKTLKADKRKDLGRKVKNLRKEGILPGNVYGKKVKSESLQVNLKDFEKIYKEVGETGLVTLEIGTEKKPVLIHNLQMQPVTDEPIHVDFLQVDLKEKVTAQVPVELSGESPAEKQGLGTVVLMLNEIEVEALPADLPEKFEIDRGTLTDVDQVLKVSDLKVDKSKVTVNTDAEELVVKVEPPQKEEVVEAPAPVEGEVPTEGQAPVAEGDQPSETAQPADSKAEEGSSDQSA